MDNNQIIELCKWDFISLEDAIAFSPRKTPCMEYIYLRRDKSFIKREPSEIISGRIQETHRFEPNFNRFGLWSWMSSNPDHQALVAEHRTEINLHSNYIPHDREQVDLICTTIKKFFKGRGLQIGVCCRGGWGDSDFLIAVPSQNTKPTRINSKPAVLIKFAIPPHTLFALSQQTSDPQAIFPYIEDIAADLYDAYQNLLKP